MTITKNNILIFFVVCTAGFLHSDNLPKELQNKITEIEHRITTIRQRHFTHTYSRGSKTRTEIRTYVQQSLQQDFIPYAYAYQILYREFNLIPQGTNLTQTLTELLGSQIGGFYLPKEKSLYINAEMKSFSDIILAHELTHALQDCYMNLETVLSLKDLGYKKNTIFRNDDIERARQSFIEGEAQYVTTLYIAQTGGIGLGGFSDNWKSLLGSQVSLLTTPPVIINELTFPYIKGLQFVINRFQINGWKTCNAIYTRLPCSSEQIIHPQKYESYECPRIIEFSNLPFLEESWKQKLNTTLGEFMSDQILFALTNNFKKSKQASEGWNGDTYALFANKKETLSLWYSLWDTPQDAREFYTLLAEGFKQTPATKIKTALFFKSDGLFRSIIMPQKNHVLYISTTIPVIRKQCIDLSPMVRITPWSAYFSQKKDTP